ncbi:MAG TPA: hypothetical protein VMV57_11045 [Terracidiphilus sp.]|nr:hypothetical protein [Terracidiphilus sp.]
MNLSEALDAALPEIPHARMGRIRPPCLDPNLVVREEMLDGVPTVGVLQRDKANYFRFDPLQWELARLFDGVRSYDEIADLYLERTGSAITTEDARNFAENMDESDFWYKSHQERNLALSEKLLAGRARRSRSKINLAHISFSAWDPDQYLGWLDGRMGRYLYSRWCVLLVLALFAFETAVFIAHWNVIGPDTLLYFNFTKKSFLDLVQFWSLFLVLGFFHESAHGLTCKHYGGQVHSMGLMFLYLTPAFYCDVTEIWVAASKLQRLATIIAGIWVEMVLCGFAMIVWVNTETGQWLHDFSYQLILLTGLAVSLINLNPLIKLDGYYFLTELIEIPDLKERSTAFLSGWFQNRILRLPVEVPVVPRRRVLLFTAYAILSGIYSYTLLFLVVRFTYNVAAHWLAEFALIPAGALAFAIFRSRLRTLRKSVVEFWQQGFGASIQWRFSHTVLTAILAALFFLPIWRDQVGAYYVIEPTQSRVLHAAEEGRVDAVMVSQGEPVKAGEPLLRMTSLTAGNLAASAMAARQNAGYHANRAELEGKSIGPAAAEAKEAARLTELAGTAESSLVVRAPADGTVLTDRPDQLVGRDVGSGQALLSMAGAGPRIVRVFIPASALDRIPANAQVAFALPNRFSILRLPLSPLGGRPMPLPQGLIAQQDYKGITTAVYYSSRMTLPEADGNPQLGMSGIAKVLGVRRSLAERALFVLWNLVRSHVW